MFANTNFGALGRAALGGVLGALVASAACDFDASVSVYEQLCQRGDECNAFSNVSVDECITSSHSCTNGLWPSDREDWESDIGACLAEPTCGGFVTCYLLVPHC